MLKKTKNWQGCGGCRLCKENENCHAFTKKVKLEFKNDEKWDNWGRMVTAFRKGTVVYGKAVIKDNTVYCASAESTLYCGVTDFVNLKNVNITEEE